ncbi:DUF3090 family protein [Nakamurella sp. PAMC28650]|jgi:uncharacterized repeat protein (TIGR03847 family)|uniref:DUF3090 family protein n=1 Tax=Nakamurella sp. PAMC28650 TaxID=2762325 RepID=UPI00164EB612|nr:DUF3090 family protein [Nakamurella sp. PAMC28650]QNK79902.1 DUF3090 family protein [Nakamurella sp. PAMC28650]
MTRQVHVFRSPDRFLAGTIGQPGEREFFVQVADGRRILSVACEKQQVAVLADRLGSLITQVAQQFDVSVPQTGSGSGQDFALTTPVDAEFRVGTMGLAWDGEESQVIVELLALSEEEVGEDIVLEDREDGPDALRVFLTLAEARDFARRAELVVSAGRPPCPLCANPLDPEGHICPRLNGYHRGAIG